MKTLLCVDDDTILDDLLVAFRWGVRVRAADRVLVLHVSPKLPWMRTIGRVDPTVGEQVAEIAEEGGRSHLAGRRFLGERRCGCRVGATGREPGLGDLAGGT